MKNYIALSVGALFLVGAIIAIFISLPDGETQFGVKQIISLVIFILGAYVVVKAINKIIKP